MNTPDDKAYDAYEAQVTEILDAVAGFRRRQEAAEAAYQTAIGYAAAAEQRATETASSAAGLIDRSLRNARQAVAGLVADTLIPQRMRASAVEPNVGHADVEVALAQLNRGVIDLRGLADRVRTAQATPSVTSTRPRLPPTPPVRSARSPLTLAIGVMVVVVIVLILFLAIPR